MLMPAAVLVMIVLGAIAVDLTVVQLGQRQVADAAASAANDAVTVGLDPEALRRGDQVLEPALVEQAARATVGARGLPGVVLVRAEPGPGADEVTVELSMPVEYVFAKGLPGGPDGTTVHASATASLTRR
jgi:hypothetical protein